MDDIQKLALLIGPDADDPELLGLLLEQAEGTLLALTGRKSLPEALHGALLTLAAVYFNRRGMEGETLRKEGPVTHGNGGVPDEIIRACRPYTLAKAVRA